MHQRCDGFYNCFNHTDERGCENHTCIEGQFQCANGLCRPDRYVCDHDDDCGDNSDEQNCQGKPHIFLLFCRQAIYSHDAPSRVLSITYNSHPTSIDRAGIYHNVFNPFSINLCFSINLASCTKMCFGLSMCRVPFFVSNTDTDMLCFVCQVQMPDTLRKEQIRS